jgi:glycosyltransferase involved in cell wall biosynthesis
MKALIVSQPGTDGVLRHVDLLCRYLISQDVRVHLAYSDDQSCDQLRALVKHVADQGGRTLNLRTGKRPQSADFAALRGLRRLIQEERPQVIHSHSSKAGGLVRVLGLLGLDVPIFYTPNAYFRMHDAGNWKARVFHTAERLLGRVGTSIVMGSFESEFARTVLRIPEARQRIIPNGINVRLFCPASPERKRLLREKFGVPSDVPLLGTVGRFSTQKDPETLYAALALVFERVPDLFFVHLGQGELEPKIDAFLADKPFSARIKRIPQLSDTTEFYQMLDGFVLPSRYEGMSYAALEALACGLPAILTDAPGNSDLAAYGFSHVWQPKPGNVDAVAEAIFRWHADRLSIQSNHREVMVQHFAEDICNSRVLAAYEEATAGRKLESISHGPAERKYPVSEGECQVARSGVSR